MEHTQDPQGKLFIKEFVNHLGKGDAWLMLYGYVGVLLAETLPSSTVSCGHF